MLNLTFSESFFSNILKYWKTHLYKIILPLFWIIARIIPRNKDIWVYAEGPVSAVLPLLKYADGIDSRRHIYITSFDLKVDQLRKDGYLSFKHSSILGCYYISRAKVHIICKSKLEDLNKYLSYNAIIINLWHGMMADCKSASFSWSSNKPQWKIDRNKAKEKKIFNRYLFLSSTSKIVQQRQALFFSTSVDKLPIVGRPILDQLFSKKTNRKYIINNIDSSLKEFDKIFAYMPGLRSWRLPGKNNEPPWDSEINFSRMNDFLTKNNSALIVRQHRLDEISLDLGETYSNIFLSSSYSQEATSAFDELAGVDVLISDCSSLTYEFLVTGRPILIYFPDYKENKDIVNLEDFNSKMPSHLNKDFNELLVSMDDVIKCNYSYDKYNKILNQYHFYKDGNSSKRVYKYIEKYLDES